MDSTIETVEQVASDELDKAKARFIGGRSIDRGNPEDDETFVHSDDEGMIEEIVTTVEEDKDLECKVKKKIETKKTVAEDPETHNKITKVVKTEVTEITRTITINDENDLERAKRELGIDDVKKFLPSNCHFQSSTSWIDQPRLTQIQEKFYDPSNEIVTPKDFPSDSPVKQNSPQPETIMNEFLKSEQSLADATTVGRGAVVETISNDEIVAVAPVSSSSSTKIVEKKKKSRLGLCSCTRSQTTDHDEEKRKQKIIEKKSKEKKKASINNANLIQPTTDEAVRTVIDDEKSLAITKENEMAEIHDENLPIYNEEQLNKILGEISQDKPLTLAEAIAYDYIDLEDPKLALQSETIRSIKNLFRPTTFDDEKFLNRIRVKRSGEIFTDFNLTETNSFEKFSQTEPLIYQLQQSFEPTLDFTEKQFRSLTEAVRNHRNEYSDLQFDIGRTLIPSGDLKESSTNDFSQSDSGYSMTTTTHESLASKVKNEFETITEPTEIPQLENNEKMDEEDQRPVNHLESRSTTLDSTEIHPEPTKDVEISLESVPSEVIQIIETKQIEVPTEVVQPAACEVVIVTETFQIEPPQLEIETLSESVPVETIKVEHLEPRPATIEPIHVESEPTPIVIPKEKHEESTVSKALENLHGASIDLPQVELVTPGPLPILTIAKEKKEKPTKKPKEKTVKAKKSSVGLCASCFGAKAAAKKKKDATNAPIEQKKEVEEIAAATPIEINETTPSVVVKDEIPVVSPAPIEEEQLVSPAPIEEVPLVSSALVKEVPLVVPAPAEVPLVVPAPAEEVPQVETTPVDEVPQILPTPPVEEPLVSPAPTEEETHEIADIVRPLPQLEDRLDATIEKLVMSEEPHYQLPSSEPVPPVVIENDYSLPDTNDYDIPRSFESPKVEEITLPKDVEVSTVEPMESKEINETSTLIASSSPQIESIMLNNGDDTMPNVDVKEKSSKGSYKLTKKKKEKTPKEKKPNFFTSIFRSSDRKSKTPALDLPAVERDLNVPGETPVLNFTSSKTDEKIDPLHVPNVDLPQLDVQLPKFDQPEVKSIELTVPSVELPPIADLDLPKDEKKSLEISSIEHVQIPSVELPEVQYKTDENQPFVLPEIHLKSSKESIVETPEVVVLPTLENGLALASPVNDLLDIQVNHSEFPVETDYAKTPIVADTPLVVESTLPVKIESTPIEEKKKTSSALCSCFGTKSTNNKNKIKGTKPIVAPKSELPEVEMPLPSSNISSTLKSKSSLRAPTTELPAVEFNEISSVVPKIETTETRTDSGLEQIISSHLTTTSDDVQQKTSTNEPLGRENSFSRHDFAKKITLNDETRTKFIFRQEELTKCLEKEISGSIDEFDEKKDEKILKKILAHAIDLIKDKKVSTYPELKQKLIVEHKNEAFIVDPVVRAFYCTLEKQGLDNIDKPEFPLAIRDMVRLPAQQTFDTVIQLNKTSDKNAVSTPKKSSSWLCGRSKTTSNVVTTPKTNVDVGLLDERRRLQLNAHRQELGTILRDRIQSSSTPIRHFNEHSKDVEKIVRKTLTSVTQPKILSYEQIRNDFKGEFKQTFFLVDPIVDVVRDTFDHCDITQMNEKTNLDILDANIAQTAQLYNQVAEQNHLLNVEELENLRSNHLNWLNAFLLQRETKIKSKQNKELTKILSRASNILSLNLLYTWDDVNSQLRREFVKTPELCDRAIELLKKGHKDGLFLLRQSPETAEQDVTTINIIQPNGKRRASSLITDRAKQNLKTNRNQIVKSITTLLYEHHKPLYTENQIQTYLNKTFHHLEGQKSSQFSTYNDLKLKLKKDFKSNHENLLEQIVDVIEQAHAVNQFDDIEKAEVQTLMKDRLDGKPLVIKEMFVSLPPRVGAFGNSKHSNDDASRNLSTSINGDRTLNSSTSSHRVARGLSWREANERARILFYRGKHPAIHYDEQAAGFDVRMLLETNAGGTQEIPVTDSDVHELLNSCGVQWDGVNIISLVDHSEDVVRAAEQAALKVIREKGLVDLRTPPTTRNQDEKDEPSTNA